jgi:ComEC/Rec2-related protein
MSFEADDVLPGAGYVMGIASIMKTIRLVRELATFSIPPIFKRIAPANWVALSAAIAFYALSPVYRILPLFALCMAGLAVTIRFPPIRLRIASTIMLSLALGLILGFSASLSVLALAPPTEFAMYQGLSLRGKILDDGKKTASGNSAYAVELQGLSFSMPGIQASLQWPLRRPRIMLVTDSSAAISKGQIMAARGVTPIPQTTSLCFAPKSTVTMESPLPRAAIFRSSLRKALVSRIHAVSGKSFPLAQALLLGIKDDIDSQEAALFRDAGCAHILALSGQHLSILCMLMTILFARVLRRQDLAGAATIGFALFFTWLAGASPSLFRACSMTALVILTKRFDRPQHGSTVLSLVFCATLLCKPSDAATLSFQLSYAAMAGLILVSGRWEYLLWSLPTFVSKPLAASLAALCATSSISLGVFGRLPLGGLVSATLSGPVVLLFMWSLLGASMVGSAMPFLDSAFLPWHEAVHAVLTYIMRLGAAMPAISPEGKPGIAIVRISIVLISLFVYAWPYIEYVCHAIRQPNRRNRSI